MLFFLILKYKHSFELLGFLLPKKILCVNLEEFCPTVLAIKKEGKCSFCISLYHIKYFAKVMRIFTKVMRLFTRKFRVIRQFAKVSSYFEEVMRFFATFSPAKISPTGALIRTLICHSAKFWGLFALLAYICNSSALEAFPYII